MTGSVYVAIAESGAVKIGISRNACRRVLELRCATRSPIRLAYHAECNWPAIEAIEKQAHAILHANRTSGEWFSATIDDAVRAVTVAARQLGYELKELSVPVKRPGRKPTGHDPVRSYRVPDELHDGLRKRARKEGITLAEMLRRILAEALNATQKGRGK